MYLEILDPKRKKLLSQLGFLKNQGFYLAGGTALALQIGHRTSMDFDFYSEKKFDTRQLRGEFDQKFHSVKEVYLNPGSIEIEINTVRMSFFRYPYGLIRKPLELEGVLLASKEDIAAMKILAISQRGTRRDFIDIYFLMKEFGLESIIDFTKEKYQMFNIYVGLQGLVYFEDADEDPVKERFRMLKKIDWLEIKKYITKEAAYFKKFL